MKETGVASFSLSFLLRGSIVFFFLFLLIFSVSLCLCA